jgi:hypothetical protein
LHFVTAVNSASFDLKNDLLTLAATLDNSLKGAITKLTAEGIASEVAVLKDLDNKLQKLSGDLKVATDPTLIYQTIEEPQAIIALYTQLLVTFLIVTLI